MTPRARNKAKHNVVILASSTEGAALETPSSCAYTVVTVVDVGPERWQSVAAEC